MLEKWFADMSMDGVRDLDEESLIVQPMGATEIHGDHLPIYTDTLISEAVASALATRSGDRDWWYLPPLAYGRSVEHAWAPGTITLTTETIIGVLRDIGRSVASTGVKRLVFLNTHGGNSAILEVVARDLRIEFGLLCFVVEPLIPADHGGISMADEGGLGVHGGADETSLMLYLKPSLVDLKVASRGMPTWHQKTKYIKFGGSVNFSWLSRDISSTGIIGDPFLATEERGRVLFEEMVDSSYSKLLEISTFDFA